MQVKDVMIPNVHVAHDHDSVEDVLRKFVRHRVGGMPIVDDEHHVIGFISDGDIMRHLGGNTGYTRTILDMWMDYVTSLEEDNVNMEQRGAFHESFLKVCRQSVLDLGAKRPICVQDTDSLEKVVHVLGQKKFKKVPVLRGGILVGIISRGDVIRVAVNHFLSTY